MVIYTFSVYKGRVSDDRKVIHITRKGLTHGPKLNALMVMISSEHISKFVIMVSKIRANADPSIMRNDLFEEGVDLLWAKYGDPPPDNIKPITDKDE
jgi:hypothetical protein